MVDADWYPDPSNLHEHRYWDGAAWTENVADNGVASTAVVDATFPPPAVIPTYQPAAAVPTQQPAAGVPTTPVAGPGSTARTRWIIGGAIGGVVLLIVIVLLATSGGGGGGSVSAFCSQMKSINNNGALQNIDTSSPDGLKTMSSVLGKLESASPSAIKSDVKALHDAIDDVANGRIPSADVDPSGAADAITSYTTEHCGFTPN